MDGCRPCLLQPPSESSEEQCHCPRPHRQYLERPTASFSKELSRALEGRELLVTRPAPNKPVCNTALSDITRRYNTQ